MKFFLLAFLLFFSLPSSGDNLEDLLKKIEALESKVRALESDSSSNEGLKVQDLSNTTITEGSLPSSALESGIVPDEVRSQLTQAQLDEIMATLSTYKENKKKYDEQLKELSKYLGIEK